jgi:replication factor C large subunit
LHGPPGVGKTTLAQVIANEKNFEIFELNASDFRNRKNIRDILKPALEQKSLGKEGKIILIDEVDGVATYADYGGVNEIINLISDSKYPVILTANDVWKSSLSSLRRISELVQLKEMPYKVIRDVLISILRKENKFVDNKILLQISIKAKGDLRAAINDLYTISNLENPEDIFFDERNKELDIFNALKLVFKGKPNDETLRVFDSVNMDLDEIILWIEENIPLEYSGEELAKAYDRLSKVDVFRGRIHKQQYWRFLVYENLFLSYGISASKKISKTGFTSYKKPTRVLKIWLNNQRTAKKKTIAKKYAKLVHVGEKRALREFPIIKQIIKSDDNIQKELKLTEEEIEYLSNKN